MATPAKAATCTEEGNTIYWTCSSCGKHFSDESGTTEIESGSWVIPALGHSLSHIPAIAASCTTSGNLEHWHCSTCGHDFSDSAAKNDITDSVVVAALGHSLTSHMAVAATCTTAGNSAYWTCSVCGKHFSDALCTTEVETDSWVLPALGHSLEYVPAVSASCTASGNIEHWHCSTCGKNYSDSAGSEELESVVIPMVEHSYGYSFDESQHWFECSECGSITGQESHSWGDVEVCADGHHYIRRCTVCGAIRNEDVDKYTSYGGGALTILVPNAEQTPCGTVKTYWVDNVCHIAFVPNLNSAETTFVLCYLVSGEHTKLTADSSGEFTFTDRGRSEYRIQVQVGNSGGTNTYEKTIQGCN